MLGEIPLCFFINRFLLYVFQIFHDRTATFSEIIVEDSIVVIQLVIDSRVPGIWDVLDIGEIGYDACSIFNPIVAALFFSCCQGTYILNISSPTVSSIPRSQSRRLPIYLSRISFVA